jgi:hypothetical protein
MPIASAQDKPREEARRDAPPRRGATPEEVAAMLDVLREMEPGLARDIDKWRQENPERVAELINRRFPRLRHMVELRRQDRELYDLRISDIHLSQKSLELVRAYRAASLAKDAKAADIRQSLHDTVTEQFEVRQRIRQRELQRLEQRIAQLRKELEDRAKARDRILNDELKKMLEAGEPARN